MRNSFGQLKNGMSTMLACVLILTGAGAAQPAAKTHEPVATSIGELITRAPATPSLFAQSAAQRLTRDFNSTGISFLLFDAQSGELLASRWDDPDAPIPVGSLLKPFAALAYGRAHDQNFPTHLCTGDGCWLPHGHGELTVVSAIANSCNAYFRLLTAQMTTAQIVPIVREFALDPPDAQLEGAALFGAENRWAVSPLNIARAYFELIRRRHDPMVSQVIAGLEGSALTGTGSAVDRHLGHTRALAKTGTAKCTHSNGVPGDGFTVALVPAENPQLLLLVRVHGVPGAQAAITAGEMLRDVGE